MKGGKKVHVSQSKPERICDSPDGMFNVLVAACGGVMSLVCLRKARTWQTGVAATLSLCVNVWSGTSSLSVPVLELHGHPALFGQLAKRIGAACRASARVSGIRTLVTAAVSVWTLSVMQHNASIVDVFWALSFVLQGTVYCLHPQARRASNARLAVVWAFTVSWAMRLSTFLWWRNHQSTVGMGLNGISEDFRYQKFRQYWDRKGLSYWWFSFFQVFGLQGALSHVVSAPLLAVATKPQPTQLSTPTDVVGIIAWAVGYFFEHVGDLELTAFKSDPLNRGTFLTRGVWGHSRHPNYFGNALMWWGIYCIACSARRGWTSVSGPLVMTFLLTRVSGVAMLEQALRRSRGKEAFARYTARVGDGFVPWQLLRALPSWVLS